MKEKRKNKNPHSVALLFLTMTQQVGELSILRQSGPAEPPRKGGEESHAHCSTFDASNPEI